MTIPRRSVALYATAWGLWLAAAACVGASARGFLESTDLLWVAVVIAAAATVAAAAAVLTAGGRP